MGHRWDERATFQEREPEDIDSSRITEANHREQMSSTSPTNVEPPRCSPGITDEEGGKQMNNNESRVI